MLKKIFRSAYEDVRDDQGKYLSQTVKTIKTVEVPTFDERWDVIASMSKENHHQVMAVHDIQASFVLSALQNGAKLADIELREVEKPVLNKEEGVDKKPATSLLSRFLGVSDNDEVMKESRLRIHTEHQERYLQYQAMQEFIRTQLEEIAHEPNRLSTFYEGLGNHYVDVVKVEKNGVAFTLESNGFFSYAEPTKEAKELEEDLVKACVRYFS